MTAKEFNEKYKPYIPEGWYGLGFNISDVTDYLDNVMEELILIPGFELHQIKLKLAGSELSLFAEDLDFANEASERLTCNYDGDDLEIAFNSRFLMEMVSNLEATEIQLSMSETGRAGILTPCNPENANEEVLMLVMPVMLNR